MSHPPAIPPVPGPPAPLPRGDLSGRIAGHAVIEQLLIQREADPPRGLLRRVLGASPLTSASQPWYSGAVGERSVGRRLARLGEDWTVLHAVPVGRGSSDIDHVVIGPGGVFTLNTKRHAGQSVWTAGTTFLVAGRKQPYLRNALHEAERASKLLSSAVGAPVQVHGALVVVDAKTVTVKDKHPAVAVLEEHQVPRWLERRPPVLTREEVTALSAAAVQGRTWHKTPERSTDPALLEQQFSALHTMVRRARRRRGGWALAMLAAGSAALAGVLPAVAAALPAVVAALMR
jgi:hypothetical protein